MTKRCTFAMLLLAATLALPLATTTAASAKEEAVRRVRVVEVSRDDLKAAVAAEAQRIRENRPGRIWCVPFARAVSGIEIKGDAATWWGKAGDVYPKGQVPVAGSVLNFRATGGMPRGHVAVVSEVIDSRVILVDQANWVTNRITQDTVVMDVSPNNDWSAVRVANQTHSFGSVYPTFGFIYRPQDQGA